MSEPAGHDLERRLASALPRLRAHLGRAVGASAALEPDDLVQEVFARALRYRASFDEGRALWPWLRQLAQRTIADQLRSAERRPATLEELEPPAPRAVNRNELAEEVTRVLALLTPPQRAVLVRFHQREQSVEQIARELGMPAGTVKSHLSRARRRLAGLPHPEDER